jgi:hypothetical protein
MAPTRGKTGGYGTVPIVTAVAVALAAAALGGFAATKVDRGGSSQVSTASGKPESWRRHEGEGFAVEFPGDWNITKETSGRVTVSGTPGERVVLWPVFVPRPLDDAGAARVAAGLAAKALPGFSWNEPFAAGTGVARLTGSSRTATAVSLFAYSRSRAGSAGYFYVAAAPRRRFDRLAPTFARIVGSFEARGEPVKRPKAARFTRWRDPAEGAFSVEIPEGWSASGGTERPSSLLVQATVRAVSPDSQITALMTDALPLYVEPNQVLEFAGIREGGTYTDPTGFNSPVRGYDPGAGYVRDYVLPARVPGAEITRIRTSPELASQLATYGINTYDAGEIEYRFERNGVRYTGGALCVTERISLQGYSGWHVWRLFLVEAPSQRYGEAVAALRRLADSFRIDADWARRQSETTTRQAAIISQMGDDIRDTLTSGYWERQRVLDALGERRSRATLEVEDVTDQATGATYRVESGSNYYWIDPRGTIVGTNTDTRPDVDFRELVELRP